MAGIYLHIPFCKQACHYCDFHFSTQLKNIEPVVKAIIDEIELKATSLQKEDLIQTIYFGGGTPSILSELILGQIIEALHRNYRISATAEWTLEANPDDVSVQKIKAWQALGINRLSIGIQSFFESELVLMNRAHSAPEGERSVKQSQDSGISNITIDLIYGMPNGSKETWAQNVSKAIALEVPHISSYALTVEEKTALHHFVRSGKISAPSEELAHENFLHLRAMLLKNGFDHYEISNFAKPGFQSQHNTAYWKGIPFLGIGPGAHEFQGNKRRWNVSNNPIYTKKIMAGEPWYEEELLSENDQWNEAMMTQLRLVDSGIDIERLSQKFPDSFIVQLKNEAQPWLSKGDLELKDQHLILTEKALFRADGIAASLFRV